MSAALAIPGYFLWATRDRHADPRAIRVELVRLHREGLKVNDISELTGIDPVAIRAALLQEQP